MGTYFPESCGHSGRIADGKLGMTLYNTTFCLLDKG
jgi:hypothetical protein